MYLFSLLLAANFTFAQQKQISGTVTSKIKGIPLTGVSVKAGNTTVVTDEKGKFSIPAYAGQTLMFSYVGMQSSTLKITSAQKEVAVELVEDAQSLEAVVVVGYTTEKKKDIKGAVAVVNMSETMKETNANLVTSLQGRVPGVNITTDGAPGSGISINIRGNGNFSRNTPPLFVVDGIPTYDFNGLSPNDIESMQVLKDAASVAIYGARGANGVIVITTKKGKSAKAKVTFDAFYGVKTLRNKIAMLNATEYGQVLWQQKKNDNQPLSDGIYGTGAQPVIPAFLDDNKTIPSADVDYLKEVYQPAANMSYNLGISKASDKSSFYLGANYNREDGLAKYTLYDRLTVRMNSSFKVSDKITLGANASIGYLTGNREAESRTIESAIFQNPIIPLKDNLGNWGGPVKNLGDRLSPIGQLYLNRNNKNRGWRTFGNVFTDIEIIKGLTYHGAFAVDVINSGFKGFYPKYVMGRFTQSTNSLTETSNKTLNLTATHTLHYHWQKAKHDVQVLAGYEWIHNTFSTFSATRQGFTLETPDYTFLNAGQTILAANGTGNEYGLIGQFGKIDYNYDDRYLVGASVRRDGSSRFSKTNQYGVFPAVSAAWRISNEAFFRKSILSRSISDLKLRGSWGRNGYDNIPDYNYSTFFAINADYGNYDITGANTSSATGFYTVQIGNESTKWESAQQTDIGLDLGLFNNRLYLTADYFKRTSKDLLYKSALPAVVGEGQTPYINVGDLLNTGVEFLISYRNKSNSKLRYTFDLSFTSIANKALSVGVDGNDKQYGPHSILVKGQPVGEFYGWIAEGIFKSQGEVDKWGDQPGKGVGRIKYRDVNGDGKIDAQDRTYLGSPLPKFTAGFNANIGYGNFDATLFFDAIVGNKIYDEINANASNVFFNSNHYKSLLNAWSPANTGADIPMVTANNTNNELRSSSFYISDGSYLRLKSAVIGYSLPKAILSRLKIANARVFVQGQNILNLTKFKGFDYEILNTDPLSSGVLRQTVYPHSKSISFGLNIGF
jgi:TonB-linked SusC/RagA family outer membrane protein